MRLLALIPVLALVAAACSDDATVSATGGVLTTTSVTSAADGVSTTTTPVQVLSDGSTLPPAPGVPTGDLAPATIIDIDSVFATLLTGVDTEALARLGETGDARIAWLLADLLRFFSQGPVTAAAVASFESLTGTTVSGSTWNVVTNRLIGWDLPAPPGYVGWKRTLFTIVEPAWDPFFSDENADVDWRHLSWGGVLIDDRPTTEVSLPCPGGCIPALDDPAVTNAAGGDWYPDDLIVFGVVVNGEARAYPKNIMEIHEMVNDTLGGVRIGIPYCTLCGSAQAYITDSVPDGFGTLELRTTGLLTRSNKVMFDLNTFSMFDTFLGTAVTGPLREVGFTLEPVTVITSTWADWKAAHPDTTIVAQDGGIGRTYALDPLGDRDADGPIFPIGDVDQRLPVQEQVLGLETPDGTAVAFAVDAARRSIEAGETVELAGVVIVSDGAGLVALLDDGSSVTSHQSFWFAWSQFHPNTLVWTPLG
jgi:hypothetical protein